VAAGVVLRVAWIAIVGTTPISDCAIYLSRGLNIANGSGYSMPDGSPTAYWPVGYPAFLALTLKIGGGNLILAKVANILVYVLTVLLLRGIVRSTSNHWNGILPIAYLSLSPNQISYANLFASEPLALLTVAGTLYCFIRFSGTANNFRWLAAGCCTFAVGFYVRPPILLLPLLLAVGTFLLYRRVAIWRRIAVLYIVLVIAIFPWALRNYKTFGKWIPISTNGGINFYIGNNSYANGTYNWNDAVTAPLEGLNEVAADKKARELSIRYIISHPLSTLSRIPLKQWHLWRTDAEGVAWNLEGMSNPSSFQTTSLTGLKIIAQSIYVGCIVLSLVGLVKFWKLTDKTPEKFYNLLPLGVVAYYTVLYCAFFGTSRFHFVFLPFLFLYGDELYIRKIFFSTTGNTLNACSEAQDRVRNKLIATNRSVRR
jgi:4-amino-4-deoxy-L-arabinose transferase-like glycosyltransferase